MNSLTRLLVETGLVQFGSFYRSGEETPIQTHFDMLASYPDVLRALVQAAVPLIPRVDHILATADAVPLGVALSLETGVPLVYSRGSGDSSVSDLVGAYDIGHPALLLTSVLSDDGDVLKLAASASRVGLETRRVLCVLNLRVAPLNAYPVSAVLPIDLVVDELTADNLLPAHEGRALQAWLRRGCKLCE